MKTTNQITWAMLAVAVLCGCKGKEDDKPKPKAPPSIPGWIARDTVVTRELLGSGSLLADAVVDLRCEIAARVEKVGFREGQQVKAGQLLVKLASGDLKAAVDKARANVDLAKATLERSRQQLAIQAVSQQAVDQAVQTLESAKADLALAEVTLAKSEIRAPFDGKVGTSPVAVGQYLTVGQTIATVAKTHPLKVEFEVPGDDVARVHPGMAMGFRPFGIGSFRQARIAASDPVLDTLSRTLKIHALWSGDAKGLVPGQAVEIRITMGIDTVYMLPPQALGADAKVLVLHEGKAMPRVVQVGLRTASSVEVRGLKTGDTVLCNGAVPVKPGSVVKPSRYL
jgi:membrane fusion protein (multidrug efflux system)